MNFLTLVSVVLARVDSGLEPFADVAGVECFERTTFEPSARTREEAERVVAAGLVGRAAVLAEVSAIEGS